MFVVSSAKEVRLRFRFGFLHKSYDFRVKVLSALCLKVCLVIKEEAGD